jgi:hypothetical protein
MQFRIGDLVTLAYEGNGTVTAKDCSESLARLNADQCEGPAAALISIVEGKLLKNLAANAEAKGLNVEKSFITHFAVQRAIQGRRRTYRAHGRIGPYLSSNCHIEFIATEKAENVKRAAEDKKVRLTKKQAAKQRLAIGK